ncbi:MAG: hypothetical protein EOO22_04325 [Comamonadaceae bacterium]|nr:MAG: hypothetical protein EOO22_04325 [Comamonadaceae bacterium]
MQLQACVARQGDFENCLELQLIGTKLIRFMSSDCVYRSDDKNAPTGHPRSSPVLALASGGFQAMQPCWGGYDRSGFLPAPVFTGEAFGWSRDLGMTPQTLDPFNCIRVDPSTTRSHQHG